MIKDLVQTNGYTEFLFAIFVILPFIIFVALPVFIVSSYVALIIRSAIDGYNAYRR